MTGSVRLGLPRGPVSAWMRQFERDCRLTVSGQVPVFLLIMRGIEVN